MPADNAGVAKRKFSFGKDFCSECEGRLLTQRRKDAKKYRGKGYPLYFFASLRLMPFALIPLQPASPDRSTHNDVNQPFGDDDDLFHGLARQELLSLLRLQSGSLDFALSRCRRQDDLITQLAVDL